MSATRAEVQHVRITNKRALKSHIHTLFSQVIRWQNKRNVADARKSELVEQEPIRHANVFTSSTTA